ncbi:MAG: hypothetical protein EPO11_09805 [Gammaproteobacteria bacterium]|nr:MAG: hypothetical protein EPO11_09805 [Gammaproteobacteria bacterium]
MAVPFLSTYARLMISFLKKDNLPPGVKIRNECIELESEAAQARKQISRELGGLNNDHVEEHYKSLSANLRQLDPTHFPRESYNKVTTINDAFQEEVKKLETDILLSNQVGENLKRTALDIRQQMGTELAHKRAELQPKIEKLSEDVERYLKARKELGSRIIETNEKLEHRMRDASIMPVTVAPRPD